MIKMNKTIVAICLLAMFFTHQAVALTVSVSWRKGSPRASLPRGGSRSFSHGRLRVRTEPRF